MPELGPSGFVRGAAEMYVPTAILLAGPSWVDPYPITIIYLTIR
jgi:hypothetical protein